MSIYGTRKNTGYPSGVPSELTDWGNIGTVFGFEQTPRRGNVMKFDPRLRLISAADRSHDDF